MAAKEPDLTLSAGKSADWWVKEVVRSFEDWKDARKSGEDVIKRYRNERDQAERDNKRFNILFSNTETLKPAIYSQPPVPDIRRRWQDKDPAGRLAATVLQRATAYCIESYDFHSVLKRARDDYLLPGFAVARVVYKPYTKGEGEAESIVWHEAKTEYVAWDMFAMSRSKTYERVWWAAVAEDLDRSEIKEKFGSAVAGKLTYGRGESSGDEGDEGKARVWEVWCKRSRSRFFVAEGCEGWVKPPESDPLRLEGFYPWPRPLWSVTTNDTLKPLPEYCQYEDQATELDDLTERIDALTSAIRRRGIYDGAHADLFDVLRGMNDNQFVPVEDWATIMNKGGLEKVAMELPIDGVVAAIVQLEARREQVKQTIYEITGVADIVRGSSNPNETATAQQIKGRWAGLRISSRQGDFSVFARDLIRIKAEIIAERFDPQTLGLMTGVNLPMQAQKQQWEQLQQAQQQAMTQWQQMAQQAQQQGQQPPPQPQVKQPTPDEQKFYAQPAWEEVVKILRDDKLRGFKIDIETDSTVQPDADTEKQARTELLGAMGQGAQQLSAAVQTGIIDQAFAKEIFAFVMRAFKAGSAVEEALDNMQAPAGLSPQQAQQQQEQIKQQQEALQKQQQDMAKQAEAAKTEQHRLELEKKDVDKAKSELVAQQREFALKAQHQADVQALHDAHAKQMQDYGTEAEGIIKDAIESMPMGMPPIEEAMEAPAKAKTPAAAIRDIHIHTGGDKVSTVEGGGKKKPRRVRIMEQPDGSMMGEEVLDAIEGQEAPEAQPMMGAD